MSQNEFVTKETFNVVWIKSAFLVGLLFLKNTSIRYQGKKHAADLRWA